MTGVNKTLYIPLYGKAYVSRKRLFLSDKKAEEIWAREQFPLKGKSKSKWLAYYMGIRSAVFDEWTRAKMADFPNTTVIHIGCGMDSRVERIGSSKCKWYDVDFSEVIDERRRYYSENNSYKMIVGDARDSVWLKNIPESENAVIIMEGVSMYLKADEIHSLIKALTSRFKRISLLMDCYTIKAAELSKRKNPINDVGVTEVYGIDDPEVFGKSGLKFIKEHNMTPQKYIDELHGMEKFIFRKVFAGGFSKKMYRMFEYRTEREK
jgi:O-methyltransferase involved in polyketide biosynthesis